MRRKIAFVRKKFLGIVLSVLSTYSLSALADKPKLLMVGDNWCPYNCQPDAPKRGYMIDILERILAPRYALSYQLVPWSRAVSMVESDLAQLLIATPSSTGKDIVATTPFGVDRTCFFVRKDSPWRLRTLEDLKTVRIGVVQDYLYDDNGPIDTLIAGYRKNGEMKLETATGDDALVHNFRKLHKGRMDVVLENENVGLYTVKTLKLSDSVTLANCATHHVAFTHVAVPAKRSDATQIVSVINRGLSDLRRTGELKKILDRYGITDWQAAK